MWWVCADEGFVVRFWVVWADRLTHLRKTRVFNEVQKTRTVLASFFWNPQFVLKFYVQCWARKMRSVWSFNYGFPRGSKNLIFACSCFANLFRKFREAFATPVTEIEHQNWTQIGLVIILLSRIGPREDRKKELRNGMFFRFFPNFV